MVDNQSFEQSEMEIEEVPDEFQCSVCLDVMYKPVVLACGHISCFWCIFKAMNMFQGSRCPVCRNPYNHFPRVCRLLHFLLLRLYPSAYKNREIQVAEEEKIRGNASPQFEDDLLDSQLNEVLNVRDTSNPPLTAGQDLERTSTGEHNETTISTTSSSQTTLIKHIDTNATRNQVLVKDLQCGVCKQLLYRPVVLNCGHVYCEACISNPHESVCKCPACQSAHPRGFPNVCLVLKHFLEEQFPEEYSARKESSANFQSGCPSANMTDKDEQGAQKPSVPENIYPSLRPGFRPKVHYGVGCDYCGMYPIIGERYKCKDCVEKIGFDLCEGCYDSSSKLPGRFNQQHTEEHQFGVVEPLYWRNLILNSGAENSED